ncbi:hypothetical protein [Streptomyces sp. NBC_00343]|uniref:hypothetical protein n=1 Tax=Streptomyces sp. NBC_00343 TaxID=2975719 RepID=UPI002E2C649C|nr:hypothetical protein [Streptomyces sp. NBC_00343]
MRWGVLLAMALLLSGCGIPPTGIVQSGDPASGLRSGVLLYFIADDGHLVPVSREIAEPVDVRQAIGLLFAGPDDRDRMLGLTTALTRTPPPAINTQDALVTLRLPAGTDPLPPLAARQLICTTAEARLTEDRNTVTTGVTVVVIEPGGQRTRGSSHGCSVLAARSAIFAGTAAPAVVRPRGSLSQGRP